MDKALIGYSWWGWKDKTGNVIVKKYMGEQEIRETRASDFVVDIIEPFDAISYQEAFIHAAATMCTPGMVSVPFTQYLLPDGTPRQMATEVSGTLAKEVKEILDAGAVFECEILRTGHVSMTIEYKKDEDDHETLAHEIATNGPEVQEKVKSLISFAASRLKVI